LVVNALGHIKINKDPFKIPKVRIFYYLIIFLYYYFVGKNRNNNYISDLLIVSLN